MAHKRVGRSVGDIILALFTIIFLLVCFVGGFGSMIIKNGVDNAFAVAENPEAVTPVHDTHVFEESGFVKSWAYDADSTEDTWTKIKADWAPLKDTTLELKEDGTGVINYNGEDDVDITWTQSSPTEATLFDQEGNPFPLKLTGDENSILVMDFPSHGMAFSEAEEEEEAQDAEETPDAQSTEESSAADHQK